MRYMIMFRNDGDSEVDVPPCLDLEEMGNFIGELQSTGVLLGYEGLKPSEKGARVRVTGGRRNVMDGPFTEAKELVAGFALVQVPSRDAAIDLAEQFLHIAGQGSAEVREAFEPKGEAVETGAVRSVRAAVMA
ncbi:MAG TPA: YciI family protein [Longimicrobium sp.]|nr:YciI family protein [Longimicrobium sp.]